MLRRLTASLFLSVMCLLLIAPYPVLAFCPCTDTLVLENGGCNHTHAEGHEHSDGHGHPEPHPTDGGPELTQDCHRLISFKSEDFLRFSQSGAEGLNTQTPSTSVDFAPSQLLVPRPRNLAQLPIRGSPAVPPPPHPLFLTYANFRL
ncbi:MAG: hypothetical protein ACQKBY_00065 [Verrucomicrobiales bacterium]